MRRLTGIYLASALAVSLLLAPVSTAVAGTGSSGSGPVSAVSLLGSQFEGDVVGEIQLQERYSEALAEALAKHLPILNYEGPLIKLREVFTEEEIRNKNLDTLIAESEARGDYRVAQLRVEIKYWLNEVDRYKDVSQFALFARWAIIILSSGVNVTDYISGKTLEIAGVKLSPFSTLLFKKILGSVVEDYFEENLMRELLE